MTDFQNRLQQAVERSGKSPRAISMAAKLSPGTVSELLKNSQRSPSVENLRAIARVLGTSFIWLAEGVRANERPSGFADSDVAPWIPKSKTDKHGPSAPDLSTITALLAPKAREAATYITKVGAPLFGLLPGDLLVIDMNTKPRDGDVVLATVADLNTGSGTTVLRKLATPYLLSPDPQDTGLPLVADGNRTVIMGPVVAVARSPAFIE